MRRPNNPFLLSGYHSASYFCDREGELAELKDHMKNDRNVVLFSWRRLGKSALIKRYLNEETKNKKIEAVYIDLMATSNTQKAIETLIEGVYQQFGKTKSGISNAFQGLMGALGLSMKFDPFTGLPSFSLTLNPHSSSSDNLQSIGEFLSSQKKQIVIAIDEFQQISRYNNENAEAVFRSFMQSFPDIRFIFSGSHRQMMSSMFMESKRPFYKSCQMMSLEAIPLVNYTRFIQHHFKKNHRSILAGPIVFAYDWSRGQTYSMQLIFNKLYGSNLPLNEEAIKQIINEILDQESSLFANYFNLLTSVQWKVMQAIAKSEKVRNPLSQDFLNEYQLGAASTVSSALKVLVEKELIVKENQDYFVHDIIFSRWLKSR